jgi:hypothetical protein
LGKFGNLKRRQAPFFLTAEQLDFPRYENSGKQRRRQIGKGYGKENPVQAEKTGENQNRRDK